MQIDAFLYIYGIEVVNKNKKDIGFYIYTQKKKFSQYKHCVQ